jgi:hypothetical protein
MGNTLLSGQTRNYRRRARERNPNVRRPTAALEADQVVALLELALSDEIAAAAWTGFVLNHDAFSVW